MSEGTKGTLVLERRLDEELVDRVLAAVDGVSPMARISAGLEAMIEIAEEDPGAVREELWTLRGDRVTLERLEGCLAVAPERATLALGAAIQLAGAELASPHPDLRSRSSELLRWLEGDW